MSFVLCVLLLLYLLLGAFFAGTAFNPHRSERAQWRTLAVVFVWPYIMFKVKD